MTADLADPVAARSRAWTWWICTLLLFASSINYMDRQTLATASKRITERFQLTEEQYGRLEWAFGWAFAVGATTFGIIADRVNVRWLYPCVLLAWSLTGMATGLVTNYEGLFACRLMLGLFEAGHWPCALKTTQRLLEAKDRTLGNSVLQSGTAIGAIVTPQIMKLMLTSDPDSWRMPFVVIGGIGLVWIVFWLLSVRSADLKPLPRSAEEASHKSDSIFALFQSRRFLVLVVVVVSINTAWHLTRVWLPKFLQQGRGYDELAMLNIVTWYNIATDIGCIGGGLLSARLILAGMSVTRSRLTVFGIASLLAALLACIPWMGRGWVLEFSLYLAGAGLLALFPCFYSFAQDLSTHNLGKVSGFLGTIAWVTTSPLHSLFGRQIDLTKNYDMALAFAGIPPLIALAALVLFWGKDQPVATASSLSSERGA